MDVHKVIRAMPFRLYIAASETPKIAEVGTVKRNSKTTITDHGGTLISFNELVEALLIIVILGLR